MSNAKNLLQICLFSFFQLADGKHNIVSVLGVTINVYGNIINKNLTFEVGYHDKTIERRIFHSREELQESIPSLVIKCEEIIALAQK